MDELIKKQMLNQLLIEMRTSGIDDKQLQVITSTLSTFANSLIEVGKEDYCANILSDIKTISDIKEKLFIVSPIAVSQEDCTRIKTAFIKKYNENLDLEFENIVNKKLCHSGLLLKYKDLEIDLSTENKIKIFMNLLNN